MRKFFANNKKNSRGSGRTTRIEIVNDNFNRNTIIGAFLLQIMGQDATEPKVKFWDRDELNNSRFKNQIATGRSKTVGIAQPPTKKIGRDYDNMYDVRDSQNLASDPIAQIIVAETHGHKIPGITMFITGRTCADIIGEFEHKKPSKAWDLMQPLLVKRYESIKERLPEITTVALANDVTLKVVAININESNAILKKNAARENVDILIHMSKDRSKNFISASEKGKKFLPAVLKKIRLEEPTIWETEETSGDICSHEGGVTRFSLEKLTNTVITALKNAEIVEMQTETAEVAETPKKVNGNGMAKEAMHHTSSLMPHNDAFTEKQVIA